MASSGARIGLRSIALLAIRTTALLGLAFLLILVLLPMLFSAAGSGVPLTGSAIGG